MQTCIEHAEQAAALGAPRARSILLFPLFPDISTDNIIVTMMHCCLPVPGTSPH